MAKRSTSSPSSQPAKKASEPVRKCPGKARNGNSCKRNLSVDELFCNVHMNMNEPVSSYPETHKIGIYWSEGHVFKYDPRVEVKGADLDPMKENSKMRKDIQYQLNTLLKDNTFRIAETLDEIKERNERLGPNYPQIKMTTEEVMAKFTELKGTVVTSDDHVLAIVIHDAINQATSEYRKVKVEMPALNKSRGGRKSRAAKKSRQRPQEVGDLVRVLGTALLEYLAAWNRLPQPPEDKRSDGVEWEKNGGVAHLGVRTAQGQFFKDVVGGNTQPSGDISETARLNSAYSKLCKDLAAVEELIGMYYSIISPSGYLHDRGIVEYFSTVCDFLRNHTHHSRKTNLMIALVVNHVVANHADVRDCIEPGVLTPMLVFGEFVGGLLVFPALGLYINYLPGTLVFAKAALLEHFVTDFHGPESIKEGGAVDMFMKEYEKGVKGGKWHLKREEVLEKGYRVGMVQFSEQLLAGFKQAQDNEETRAVLKFRPNK
ncbi:hypothetical protein HDU98_000114 [Podochytrium sp. JEL0797]|nr:hypothetical protein HDU98_000114 [Podochytrium sp. JEL0797]